MSTLTVDQLKKALSTKGVQLPPTGAKKSEYVKLYEQHVVVNESLGENYSSDDDTPLSASWNVSSSSSPRKTDALRKEIERMTDEELYDKLQENHVKSGPVVPNTRRVYENKLYRVLNGETTNGMDVVNTEAAKIQEEFSDSDVEPIKPTKLRNSVSRDSPKPSFKARNLDENTPVFAMKPARQSFIETRRKGSTERYIEPSEDGFDQPASLTNLRARYGPGRSNDKPYVGTWNPKVTVRPSNNAGSSGAQHTGSRPWKVLAFLGVVGLVALGCYIFYQWSANDPYKLIEDDAQREISDTPTPGQT